MDAGVDPLSSLSLQVFFFWRGLHHLPDKSGFIKLFDAIKRGWDIMNHSWAFPPSWVKGGVREGTRYRGLTTWSLLHWLWLQMTSNAQDGIFRYFGFISVQWVEVKWNGLSILMSVNGSHQQAHKGNRDKPTTNSTHTHTHTHTPKAWLMYVFSTNIDQINVCFAIPEIKTHPDWDTHTYFYMWGP